MLLYQDYVHITCKHNLIYSSVCIKHGGWPFQEVLYIVSLCWWQTLNKVVSLSDLSLIFVQLLWENRVQTIHTDFDDKIKGFICNIYIVHNM